MAKYDVKYNPSREYIPGATQMGNIAVAIGKVDYSTGGWFAGVDDEQGYIIYSDTSSTNLVGKSTGNGSSIARPFKPTFFRSKGRNDEALLNLINVLPGNTQSFTDINEAKEWVNKIDHMGLLIIEPGCISNVENPSWFFYQSTEGDLLVGSPFNDGSALFVERGSSTKVTYNPKYLGETPLFLYFNTKSIEGVNYISQFSELKLNGGSICISQDSNSITYYVPSESCSIVESGEQSFFTVNAHESIIVNSNYSNFSYELPINIQISR